MSEDLSKEEFTSDNYDASENHDEVVEKQEEISKPQIVGNDYAQKKDIPDSDSLTYNKVVLIGIGQGGSNVARTMQQVFDIPAYYINTSAKDLSAIDVDAKYKFHMKEESEGSGKNRTTGKNIYKSSNVFERFTATAYNNIFGKFKTVVVCFSTSGGSGSASGPNFVAKLTSYVKTLDSLRFPSPNGDGEITLEKDTLDEYRPNVLGLAVLPDINVDHNIDSLQNTYECLNDIRVLIDKRMATFALTLNKFNSVEDNNSPEAFEVINKSIACDLFRLFRIYGSSSKGTLDLMDRFSAVSIPGLLTIVDPKNKNHFYKPKNIRAKKLIAELSIAESDESDSKRTNLRNYLASNSIAVDDEKIGYLDMSRYRSSNVDASLYSQDLIVFTGINSMNEIAGTISHKIKDIMDTNNSKDNMLQEQKVFKDVANIKDNINASRSKNTFEVADIDDLV